MRSTLAFVFILALVSVASALSVPKTVVIDGGRMHESRTRLMTNKASSSLKKALKNLEKNANSWLSQGPWSVLDKGIPAPGGTINDYVSKAPYFWPSQPKTADNPQGCPYKEKDGVRNPEVDVGTDRQAIGKVCTSAPLLAFAWYYTGNSKYSKHAAQIIKTWFLNAKTAMNPNIDHGQIIPCANTGRSIGIIDFSQMYTSVLDAVAVLDAGPAPGWTHADTKAFVSWNKQFRTWLTNSTFGQQELGQTNNHGTFADMQLAALALFTGDKATAAGIAGKAKSKRINTQIASDGSQPQELARTRSFHYSNFNLLALTRLAQIGQKVGVNLWTYTGPQGQSIKKAVNFVVPAASGAKEWTFPELNFTRYAATDVVHSASDAGDRTAKAAVYKLQPPPMGDLWLVRPAPEQLDSIAG